MPRDLQTPAGTNHIQASTGTCTKFRRVYRRLARAYLRWGKKNEAIENYQRAIKAGPYYWRNYADFASANGEPGNYKEAVSAFQRVIELTPENILGYQGVGGVYFSEGKFKGSIPYYRKALAIRPDPDVYTSVGTVYF